MSIDICRLRLAPVFAGLLTGFLLEQSSSGQTSELYLNTHGDGIGTIFVVQNGVIQRQWTADGASGSLVVLDSIRTAGHYGGVGAEFTLSGTTIGAFSSPATTGMHVDDSTTDGSYIYGWAYDLPGLVRFDLDWSNPVLSFGASDSQWASVAYDPTDGTFWLAGFLSSVIEHRDAQGMLLGSFPVTSSLNIALALDPADDSLWLSHWATTELEQWTKDGTLLQSINVLGLGLTVSGGEFKFRDSVPPVISCPPSVSVIDSRSPPVGDLAFFTVTASDVCDPAPSVTCVPPSGSFFPRGTTMVTCTATDASGNQSVCMFPVVVMPTIRERRL